MLVRLVFRRVAGFLPDGVDEPLALARIFDGQVEDTLVVDLEKLRQVFGDKEILRSLNPRRC